MFVYECVVVLFSLNSDTIQSVFYYFSDLLLVVRNLYSLQSVFQTQFAVHCSSARIKSIWYFSSCCNVPFVLPSVYQLNLFHVLRAIFHVRWPCRLLRFVLFRGLCCSVSCPFLRCEVVSPRTTSPPSLGLGTNTGSYWATRGWGCVISAINHSQHWTRNAIASFRNTRIWNAPFNRK